MPLAAAALDVQAGPVPEYLNMKFRAEWRMKPLSEVLEEVQKAIEKPVVATAAVQTLAEHRRVILVDDRKAPLRETLERLESIQDLRFTAEPLRLRVEATSDVTARCRRPVDLNLSEYMVFNAIRDFPGPELGLVWRSSGSGKGEGPVFEGGGIDTDGLQAWLRLLTEVGEMRSDGRTALHVLATPEEEASLRKKLTELLDLSVRQTSWRITWGLAPAATELATGIVPAAEAARTAAGLEQPIVEQLHALAGQRVHGGRLREQAYVSDAEIVSSRLDPVTDVLNSGRQADLCPLPGNALTLLEYRLSWVDPTAMTPAVIGEGPAAPPPTKAGEDGPPPPPGESVTLQLPTLWTWQPTGDVVLPHGKGLVLCAEHPQGRAVVVVEEVR